MAKFKNTYPLWFILFFYWLLTFGLLVKGLGQTDGQFIYPLDDTYIHMAIGKHFVQDGAWSVTGGVAFTSTTSSPLWTLLVAASYAVFGVNDGSPLILNLLFGSAAIILSYSLLKKKARPLPLTLYLLLIVLFIPLPILTLAGMEHTLHSWLSLWLLFSAAKFIASKEKPTRGQLILLMVLSALVSSARYEGLFLVAAISFLLLLSRRFSPALLIGGAGLLPVVAYGLIAVGNGWDFLPTSLMLKGNTLTLSLEGIFVFFARLPTNLLNAPHILLLIVACLILFLWLEERKIPARQEKTLLLLFLLTTLLHMQFASVGWFFRYESYLILAGCVILASLVKLLRPAAPSARTNLIALALAFFLFFPLGWRTMKAFSDYPSASMNIYHQHYQMALFLKEYYSGRSVAANDIGAINYLADIQGLDLYGLGTVEVARAKQTGQFNQAMMTSLVNDHGVEILILYNVTFEGQIPPQWIEVGQWQISNRVVVGSDTLSFYAPGPARQSEIIAHLKDFSSRLPASIQQSGMYTVP
ncbi:MAG TPA: hypothetical protein VFF78_02890 [Anaerolineaceae bacterium]|nr:hypothetical protein [Anaerolineaceae bacterium]